MLFPLEFQFTLNEEYDENELKTLWFQTQSCQKKFEHFLSGQCSEDDFCDLLSDFDIDPDEIALIYENNLKVLGRI